MRKLSKAAIEANRRNGRKGGLSSSGGRKAAQVQWHLKRGIFDPQCEFCVQAQNELAARDGSETANEGPALNRQLSD
jgi:hypothetical protein